jgi:Do/DeqQ family serine protease
MNIKQAMAIVLLSAGTTVASMWVYNKVAKNSTYYYRQQTTSATEEENKIPSNYVNFNHKLGGGGEGPVDFSAAASTAIPATVYIKVKGATQVSNNLPGRNPFQDLFGDDMFEDFFSPRGGRSFPKTASGTGVIISNDGYIVTNNHVIADAGEINVTLSNKKTFKAKLIAADASSDLALVKIEAKGLPFLLYGNSDDVKVGQWVLAIGYPLNLQTTVTAGIVSAKGRTLDINTQPNSGFTPIESFIQTDAAVNRGNSGGPLVGIDGKLIGINSAIASPTGAYAGYSFTIPVNIVKKVVADLMKYGTVQRAVLGIKYAPDTWSDEVKKGIAIKEGDGIYITEVTKDGAAYAAGIKSGDFLTKINNVTINSGADMVGQLAIYRPGDKIKVHFVRDGKEQVTEVLLKNSSGTTDIVKASALDKMGVRFETISKKEAIDNGVKGGVRIVSFEPTSPFAKARIEESFIIIRVNGNEVLNVDDIRKEIEKVGKGALKLEGIYPGYEGVYPVTIVLD